MCIKWSKKEAEYLEFLVTLCLEEGPADWRWIAEELETEHGNRRTLSSCK